MVITSMKSRAIEASSPRTEVGEIDTRAPFQSVKAAVSLFGEVIPKGEKPVMRKSRPSMEEIVLMDKEGDLILAQNELKKVRDQLENAETTKKRAIIDLEKAKGVLQELVSKLKTVCESREEVIEATDALKNRVKQLEAESRKSLEISAAWQEELDLATELYKITITELDIEKQELTKIRQDFDATLEEKLAAFQQAAEAQSAARINSERIDALSKEITAMRESLAQVKVASLQALKEEEEMMTERDTLLQSHRIIMEEVEKKMISMKEEMNPEDTSELEMMVAQIKGEITILQEELQTERAAAMESVRLTTLEIEDATKELQCVAEVKRSLTSLVDSLKLELESMKRHETELQEREASRESEAEDISVEIEKTKGEPEEAILSEEIHEKHDPGLFSTLEQLSSDTAYAMHEAGEMKKNAEMMKQQAHAARILVEEGDRKLTQALQQVEEAKAAEQIALSEIAILSKRANAARASQSVSGEKIKLSAEEFESLNRRVEESESLAKMKEEAAMAQVEAVISSKNDADKKLEAALKEIEDLNKAIEEASKEAETAEAARQVVEIELQKWRNGQEESSSGLSPHPIVTEETPEPSDTSLLQIQN